MGRAKDSAFSSCQSLCHFGRPFFMIQRWAQDACSSLPRLNHKSVRQGLSSTPTSLVLGTDSLCCSELVPNILSNLWGLDTTQCSPALAWGGVQCDPRVCNTRRIFGNDNQFSSLSAILCLHSCIRQLRLHWCIGFRHEIWYYSVVQFKTSL